MCLTAVAMVWFDFFYYDLFIILFYIFEHVCMCTERSALFYNKTKQNNEISSGTRGLIILSGDLRSCRESAFPVRVVTCSYRWPYWVNNTQPLWAGVLPVAPTGSTSQDSAATADWQSNQWLSRQKRSWNSFFVCFFLNKARHSPQSAFYFGIRARIQPRAAVWWQTEASASWW